MKNAIDFIRFALSHAKRETIPLGAELPLDIEECGTDPWGYLFGTTGHTATKELLDLKFNSYYSKKGWSRASFDTATEGWSLGKFKVCDCQGLLDVYLGTDVNANYCYSGWCTEKGSIDEIDRTYRIGEAVFYQNQNGNMSHVGWVCGFLCGEPLVVEARGLRYGVCVTKFSERPWTHRGLVTRQLIYDENCYDEPVILSITQPMIQGEAIKNLQAALNSLGYYCGSVDGKCGKLTMGGIAEFVEAHFKADSETVKPEDNLAAS